VIGAELGEVIAGRRPSRSGPGQTTVFGGVGLASQDLVVAWQVYGAALRTGVGREVDLIAW
jgi:alanine dehydrogenase